MQRFYPKILSSTLTLLLLAVISSSMFGQIPKRPFTISSEFLFTRDFSLQSPDAGKSFHALSSGVEPSLGIMFEFPTKNNFWLGVGYRWKEHWITCTSIYYKSNLRVETAHSLPIKFVWKKDFRTLPWLSRFTMDFSGGFLINRMVHSLIFGSSHVVSGASGNILYSFSDSYKNEDVNQVKASISVDGMAKIDYRLYKNFHVCLGYGYTQGFWSLAKGSYRVTGPAGFMDSGTMTNRGSYQYVVLGFRMAFREDTTRVNSSNR